MFVLIWTVPRSPQCSRRFGSQIFTEPASLEDFHVMEVKNVSRDECGLFPVNIKGQMRDSTRGSAGLRQGWRTPETSAHPALPSPGTPSLPSPVPLHMHKLDNIVI